MTYGKITKFWTHGEEIVKMENWKPIPNFDGYEVSDQGNVRSYRVKGGHGVYRVPHLLKATKKDRYRGVNLRHNGKSCFRRVASLVLLAFVGPRPREMEVCHNNSNPHDNRLENLRYDTHPNNLRDRLKLSDTQVIEMRERRSHGECVGALSKLFDVSYNTAGLICRGDSYREIGGPLTTGGRKGGKSNLTIDDVVAIRTDRVNRKLTLKEISAKYGISESAASRICCGQCYQKDGGPLTEV